MHLAGIKQPAIAQAIELSVPTLLLNYAAELNSASQAGARRAAREEGEETR